MNTTTDRPATTDAGLDEAAIAESAARFSALLADADARHQARVAAVESHRAAHQEKFDEVGLPRGLAPII